MIGDQNPLSLLATDLDILRTVNQPVRNSCNNFFKRLPRFPLQRTFPNSENVPAFFFESFVVALINFLVPCNFLVPKLFSCFWPLKQVTTMSMPETPVNEDSGIIFWQDYVRSTGKFFVVKSISKSFPEQRFSYHQLWLCILSSDTGHHSAASLFVNNICHGVTFSHQHLVFDKYPGMLTLIK